MAEQLNLKFYLDSIPDWPSEDAESEGAAEWLRRLSSLTAGQDLVRVLVTVESKVSGSMKAWIRRWNLLYGKGGSWAAFVKDFVVETDRPRTLQQTLREALCFKQAKDQSTANYLTIVKLTLKLIPEQKGCVDKPYKIPEGSASQFAFYLCNGLDPAHPFKRKDKEPPETIDEAIKQIEDLSHHNRWNDVETFEARVTKANQFVTPAIVERPVLIGGVQVAAERYSSFKEDFGNDRIDELNMEELTDMFSSWTLAAVGEPASEKRAAGTISRMNKAVARRVFGSTSLAQHIRANRTDPNPAPAFHVGQPLQTRAPSNLVCNTCNGEGHRAANCPRVQCYGCQKYGHYSRDCPDRGRSPASGPNSDPVQDRAAGSMRVQSVELSEYNDTHVSQAFAVNRPTRGVPGPSQQRRSERAGIPTGPTSQRRPETVGQQSVPGTSMQWQSPTVAPTFVQPIQGIQSVEANATMDPAPILVFDEAVAKPKRVRVPIVPDPVFVESVESLSFDMGTIAKHSGKIAGQLKAAVHTVWTKN